MTSNRLFWMRLQQTWKSYYKTIRTVVDWTVFVYFVLPAIVISFFVYRSWWKEIPSWMEQIPFTMVFVVFFLLLWGSYFLTYVQEADRIFLRKNRRLFLGLKQRGIIYSYIFQVLMAILYCFLISPFWFQHFQRTGMDLFIMASLWVSLKWVIMSVKGKLNVEVRGWRNLVRSIPIFLGAMLVWEISYQFFTRELVVAAILLVIFNTILSLWLNKERLISIHTFEQDLAIDQLNKNILTASIFQMSMDIEKTRIRYSNRKSPRLYSRSNRIFEKRTPKNGFLELFIKVTTRNPQYFFNYMQILSVTSAAAFIVPPIWLKITIVCCGTIFLLSWIGTVWNRMFAEEPFTRKYAKEDGFFSSKRVVTTICVIPFVIIVSLITVLRIYIFSTI